MGRYDDAEKAYSEALRLNPDYEEARHDLGNVLMESDRLEEAAQCYYQVGRWRHCRRRPEPLRQILGQYAASGED